MVVRSQKFEFFFGFYTGEGLKRVQRSKNCNMNPCPISRGEKFVVSDFEKIVKKSPGKI